MRCLTPQLASSYVIPEYLSSLFRSPTLSPTVVIEGVTVLVSSSADTISTFPVYIEGRANVVLHRCTVRGARLSSIVVSKGAVCDVLECDISYAVLCAHSHILTLFNKVAL